MVWITRSKPISGPGMVHERFAPPVHQAADGGRYSARIGHPSSRASHRYSELGLAYANCIFQHGVEHRLASTPGELEMTRSTSDRRRLLLQRLGSFFRASRAHGARFEFLFQSLRLGSLDNA